MFSYEFCEISKNTFFTEHLDDVPSVIYLPHHQIGRGSGPICVISTTSRAIVLLLLTHCPLKLHYIVGLAYPFPLTPNPGTLKAVDT